MFFPQFSYSKRASQELSKETFLEALDMLNNLLRSQGERITFLCVGGGAMMFSLGARNQTHDLDGVVSVGSRELLDSLAEDVADKFKEEGRSIPPDWINTQVREIMRGQNYSISYFEEVPGHTWSNLKILFAKPGYLLGMKCQAMRTGKKDFRDISSLIGILGIKTVEDLKSEIGEYVDTNFIGNQEWAILKLCIAWAFPGQTEYEEYRSKAKQMYDRKKKVSDTPLVSVE
jgi:hypothetical protein